MRYAQFSEKGPRTDNEDCCNVVEIPGKQTLFVVCDGMGGHSYGEVASKTVCDVFSAYWQEHQDSEDSIQIIQNATHAAIQALDDAAGKCHMGTTMVMACVEGNEATIAHAGDSRCYVIDIKGNVKHFTLDHVNGGMITNAFFSGCSWELVLEAKRITLEPLDRILLCTDGLYNAIGDTALLHILQCSKDVEQVADKYRDICKEQASDNYTGIIIEIE